MRPLTHEQSTTLAGIEQIDAVVAILRFVCELSEEGQAELQNRNERAYDRSVSDYYGGSSPMTDRERAAVQAHKGDL